MSPPSWPTASAPSSTPASPASRASACSCACARPAPTASCPAVDLGDEYFRHDEDAHALVGDRTGETYRLGDDVRVRLVEAIPMAGALRFEMLSAGKRQAGTPASCRATATCAGRKRPRR